MDEDNITLINNRVDLDLYGLQLLSQVISRIREVMSKEEVKYIRRIFAITDLETLALTIYAIRNITYDDRDQYYHTKLDISSLVVNMSTEEIIELISTIEDIVFKDSYENKDDYMLALKNNIEKHTIPVVEKYESWMMDEYPEKEMYDVYRDRIVNPNCFSDKNIYVKKEDKTFEVIEKSKNIEEVISATIQYIDKNIKAGKLITEMDEIVIQSANAYLRKLLADISCK